MKIHLCTTVTLAALFLCTITCRAGLGETYLECEAKYGVRDAGTPSLYAIENSVSALWSDYNGFRIGIVWMAPEGASGPADYVRINHSNMTDAQISAILNDNSQGMHWQERVKRTTPGITGAFADALVSGLTRTREFIRDDGATAISSVNCSVVLKSARLNNQEAAEAEAKKKKAEVVPKF